eukprot:36945-Eustigmatos_ZCMA.PRE.1
MPGSGQYARKAQQRAVQFTGKTVNGADTKTSAVMSSYQPRMCVTHFKALAQGRGPGYQTAYEETNAFPN